MIEKRECTKIGYPNSTSAYLAAARYRSPLTQRAYRCPHCGSWHLTTKPYDARKRART